MNLPVIKRDFQKLLELRRSAHARTLEVREQNETQPIDPDRLPESQDAEAAQRILDLLDNAVRDLRRTLIEDLDIEPEYLYGD